MSVLLSLVFAAAVVGAPNEDPSDVRRVVATFAQCTVKTKRALASKAIVEAWSVPMTIEHELITADCLDSGTLTQSPIALGAAIGEALAVTEKDELTPAQVAAAPPLSTRPPDIRTASNGVPASPPPKIERDKAMEGYRRYVGFAKLGECVIHADAVHARTLLGTSLGSREEYTAVQILSGAVAWCMPPGTAAALSTEGIRAAVGLSYYRMEMAARGVMWQPEGVAK